MGEAITMKLSLLFMVLELLTLLAYPIVFVQSRLLRFSKSREGISVSKSSMIAPVTPDE